MGQKYASVTPWRSVPFELNSFVLPPGTSVHASMCVWAHQTSICNMVTCNSSSSSSSSFLVLSLLGWVSLFAHATLRVCASLSHDQNSPCTSALAGVLPRKSSCVGPSILLKFLRLCFSSSPDAGLWGFQQCVLPAWRWPPLRAKSDALSSTFDQQD